MSKQWETKKLGDITEIVGGGTPSKSNPKYWNGDIPWLTPTDVTKSRKRFIEKTSLYITDAGLSKSSARLLPEGTVLMTSRATIGECVINKVPMSTNQGFANFICRDDVQNVFLSYFLKYKKPLFERLGSGSTFKEISKQSLKSIPVKLPSKDEQQKIASILTSVDEVIEKTEEIIEQTEKVKKGLMQELLTKGIGHTKFKKTPIGEIPEEWTVQKLGDLSNRVTVGYVGSINKSYTDESGVPLLRTGNITHEGIYLGDIKYVTEKFHEKQKKSSLSPGDIIISRHGDSGTAAVIPKELKESNCLNVVVVKKSEEMNSDFIRYMFNSGIISRLLNKTKAGSVQGVINTKEISNVLVPYPSLKEQEKIVGIIRSVEEKYLVETKRLLDLKNLKKGLMQVLLTGRVRVKVD